MYFWNLQQPSTTTDRQTTAWARNRMVGGRRCAELFMSTRTAFYASAEQRDDPQLRGKAVNGRRARPLFCGVCRFIRGQELRRTFSHATPKNR
jgi:hypothetical protein